MCGELTNPIATIADVKAFAIFIFFDIGIVFHPDDDFADYIDSKTGEPILTPNEVLFCNTRMSECFAVCEANNADIYDVMNIQQPYLEALHNGMDESHAQKHALNSF